MKKKIQNNKKRQQRVLYCRKMNEKVNIILKRRI